MSTLSTEEAAPHSKKKVYAYDLRKRVQWNNREVVIARTLNDVLNDMGYELLPSDGSLPYTVGAVSIENDYKEVLIRVVNLFGTDLSHRGQIVETLFYETPDYFFKKEQEVGAISTAETPKDLIANLLRAENKHSLEKAYAETVDRLSQSSTFSQDD